MNFVVSANAPTLAVPLIMPHFKLLNSGVTANVNLYNKSKPNLISGVLKSKVLNTNFKSNFDFNSKKVIIVFFCIVNQDWFE